MNTKTLIIASLATTGLSVISPANAATILADIADSSVQADMDLSFTGDTLGVGNSGSDQTNAAVMMFELPDFGAIANPFLSANFTMNFVSETVNGGTGDLVGLTRTSATPAVDPNDYTAAANVLQNDFLTNGMSAGLVSTDSGGDAALLAFLNSQYDSGNGAGDFVYLRISPDSVTGGRWNLTSSDGAVNANDDTIRPQIEYTAVPEPGSLALLGLGGLCLVKRRRRDASM